MADRIHANTEWLDKCARDLSSIERSISGVAGQLAGIKLRKDEGGNLKVSLSCGLRMTGTGFSGSNASDDIRQLQRAAAALSGATAAFSAGAGQAARLFENAENRAVALMNGTASGNNAKAYAEAKGPSGKDGNSFDWRQLAADSKQAITLKDLEKLLQKIIGKAGKIGKPISTTWGFIDKFWNGDLGARITELIKYSVNMWDISTKWAKMNKNYKLLSNLGKDYAKKLKMKNILGLNKFWNNKMTRSASKNAFKAFKSNFSKVFKESMKSKTAWFLEAVSAGYNNLTEHWDGLKTGTVTFDRVSVEWVTETAAGMAIGAGATALAAATLPASAPVILVGGVAVFATWAADTGFKAITGSKKGIAESIGDVAGKFYDNTLKPGAKKAIDLIKSKVSAGWAGITQFALSL